MKKVYVAGPWVFRPDAKEHAEHLRQLLLDAGFEALIPIDNECGTAIQIKIANVTMIEKCDYIIADISPFRGPSADVGTAFEIGFGFALNKPVFQWSTDRSEYNTRVAPDGMHVEDFGLFDNLMIAAAQTTHGSFEDAIKSAQRWDR